MLATAALLVLATTAQAASKYNYGGRGSYAPSYKMSAYSHEPSYESHYAEDDYREPDHDSYGGDAYSEEPSYTYGLSTKSRPAYKQSHEPRSAYRHKRSAQDGREGLQSCIRVCITLSDNCEIICEPGQIAAAEAAAAAAGQEVEVVDREPLLTEREGLQFPSCIGKCATTGPTGPHRPCADTSAAAGGRNFCYVERGEICRDVRRSILSPEFLWSTDACCGTMPC